jgi:hypothetical protein
MKYTMPKFTLPASQNTDQRKWDLAFLSKDEFIKKHGEILYYKMTGHKFSPVK